MGDPEPRDSIPPNWLFRPNWGYLPPKEHVAFARALVDAGPDLVFGHSSHVFRGIEFYEGRPILYGAGDFVDDYAVDQTERNDQSFIYVVHTENRVPRSLRLYPTLIRRCRACRASGIHELSIIQKMTELCASFDTLASWNQARACLEIGYATPEEGKDYFDGSLSETRESARPGETTEDLDETRT